eukprot:TRINITY_DN12586_c0_g1_i1.p1 TRINITY_DN12586_c0_g1~~TRINITY_DN12586_c0_g1_i1.p1  ORF type:complete len:209 (-),score=27.51 TRINITY_DN12586_c0_g1_i1:93-719(-)
MNRINSFNDLVSQGEGFFVEGQFPGDKANKENKTVPTIITDESLILLNRNLERQLRKLQLEVASLKKKLNELDSKVNDRWVLRYSRRMSIMANLFLGSWIFWDRLVNYIQKRRKNLMQVVVPGIITNSSSVEPLIVILKDGYIYAMKPVWMFFFSCFFLSRKNMWMRMIGIIKYNMVFGFIFFFFLSTLDKLFECVFQFVVCNGYFVY